MNKTYWHYFLSLEQDFIKTTDYVEVSGNNYDTYSIRYLQLILSICSEIDAVLKLLCYGVTPTHKVKNPNMDNYRKIVMNKYPNFYTLMIPINRFEIAIDPWREWKQDKNPEWWHAYNDLKHERDQYLYKANLKNSLYSLTGLFGALLYLYKFSISENQLTPWSALFDYKGSPGNLLAESNLELPDDLSDEIKALLSKK